MYYPIAIERGDDFMAAGIVFPDIPGAISAGDTVELAYDMAVEVAHIQLEELANAGRQIPQPGSIAEHRKNPDYQGWEWDLIEIDVTPYLDKSKKPV